MSETTNIEWATSTGNPWIGCTKVSPGCAHCYAAELDANRFSKTMGGGTTAKPESHWGKGAPRVRTKAFWKDAVKWSRETACICNPMSLKVVIHGAGCPQRNRPRIFPSLCDIFDEEVPIEWFSDYWQLVFNTPNLNHLVLTKRPWNFEPRIREALDLCNLPVPDAFYLWLRAWIKGQPPENVWIGVSVEDQKRADERIPLLLQIPAKVRFLSVEPLLEPVSLEGYLSDGGIAMAVNGKMLLAEPSVDWVIVGGESGSNRRDCGVKAIEGVARQCVETETACFVKQDSAFKPGQRGRISDEVWALKQFPK